MKICRSFPVRFVSLSLVTACGRSVLKNLTVVCCCLAIGFASSSCTSSSGSNSSGEGSIPVRGDGIGSAGYRAGIGDAIDIFVLEDSSFNGRYVVRASGDIILPKAGRINIAGKDLAGVESSVKATLQANQLTQATVIADPVVKAAVENNAVMAGLTVYLSGNVVRPGRVVVPFVGEAKVTAYQAITDAGGFAEFANKKRSYLLRRDRSGKSHRLMIDFTRVEKGLAEDPVLQDGDTLVVPQKFFGF